MITVQYSRRAFSEIRPKSWPTTLAKEHEEALDTSIPLPETSGVYIDHKGGQQHEGSPR